MHPSHLRYYRKAPVETSNKVGQPMVHTGDVSCSSQLHFLGQSVLHCLVGKFDAAFRLRTVGMNVLNPQFPCCSPKLCFLRQIRVMCIYVEDVALITVERRRLVCHDMIYRAYARSRSIQRAVARACGTFRGPPIARRKHDLACAFNR